MCGKSPPYPPPTAHATPNRFQLLPRACPAQTLSSGLDKAGIFWQARCGGVATLCESARRAHVVRWEGGSCRCIILSVITIAPLCLGSPAGQQTAGATGIAARPRTPKPAAPSRPGSTAPGKASRSGSPLGTRSSKSHSQTASGGLKHECTCTIRGFTRTSSWQTSSSLSGLGRRLAPPRGDIGLPFSTVSSRCSCREDLSRLDLSRNFPCVPPPPSPSQVTMKGSV